MCFQLSLEGGRVGAWGESPLIRGSIGNKVWGKGRRAGVVEVQGLWEVAEKNESSQARWHRALTGWLGNLNSDIGNGEPSKILEWRSYMMNSRIMLMMLLFTKY